MMQSTLALQSKKWGHTMYNVFTRTWWRNNPEWPNGLEPCIGPKTYIAKKVATEEQAQQLCRDYNEHNEAGRYSRKAEYEGV